MHPHHHDPTRHTEPLHKVRVIAFDIDNTLIDILQTKKDTLHATAHHLTQNGLDEDPQQLYPKLYDHALDVGIDHPNLVATFLTNELETQDDLAKTGQDIYERLEPAHVQLYPATLPTLDALRARGYELYAVTDAPRKAVKRRLPPTGLQERFERIITLEDTPNGKADPQPFQHVLDDADVSPEQLVAIGDHPVRDVSNVIELGGHGILTTHGVQSSFNNGPADHEPNATIHGLDELLTLFPRRPTHPGQSLYYSPSKA